MVERQPLSRVISEQWGNKMDLDNQNLEQTEIDEKEQTNQDNLDADNAESIEDKVVDNDPDNEDQDESDEVQVSFGEPESSTAEEVIDDSKAPEWVRDLRVKHRQIERENRELKRQLEEAKPKPEKPVLGDKPTLESCEWDEEVFSSRLESWHLKKQEVEKEAAKRQEQVRAEQAEWQSTLDNYAQAKTKLKVKDFEEKEDIVKQILSTTQQGILLQSADNAALFVCALGDNPKKAKELAAIKNPVKFAAAIGKLETELKVTQKKVAPKPSTEVRGSAPISGIVDSTLKALEAEAAKTGDRSKVIAYNREKRNAAKK